MQIFPLSSLDRSSRSASRLLSDESVIARPFSTGSCLRRRWSNTLGSNGECPRGERRIPARFLPGSLIKKRGEKDGGKRVGKGRIYVTNGRDYAADFLQFSFVYPALPSPHLLNQPTDEQKLLFILPSYRVLRSTILVSKLVQLYSLRSFCFSLIFYRQFIHIITGTTTELNDKASL